MLLFFDLSKDTMILNRWYW